MRANLNTIANEIATKEGLEKSVGVAQVKEILGLLGIRWRNMDTDEMTAELRCLIQRGGKLSQHKKG